MKYETPELTALTPAINAIQTVAKAQPHGTDSFANEASSAYADWE